jgi:hypothetical protein
MTLEVMLEWDSADEGKKQGGLMPAFSVALTPTNTGSLFS